MHWLAEAHAFPSVTDYATWRAGQPDSADPVARMLDRIEDATRTELRGQHRDDVEKEVRSAIRRALFAYHLELRMNIETESLVRREGLRLAALTSRMRELSLRGSLAAHGGAAAWEARADALGQDRDAWQEAVGQMLVWLYAAQAARETQERLYLAGHGCLFPELAEARRDLLGRAEALYRLALDRDGHGAAPDPLEALRDLARSEADPLGQRLVRMATSDARAALGEDEAAAAVLRPLVLG